MVGSRYHMLCQDLRPLCQLARQDLWALCQLVVCLLHYHLPFMHPQTHGGQFQQ